MKKKGIAFVLSFFLVTGIITTFFMVSCKKGKNPIKVGYFSILSGSQSDYTIHSRNGTLLALDSINEGSGIDGRRIELITKDINEYNGNFQKAMDEFEEEDVVAVIGPSYSSNAIKIVPISNGKKMLVISPSVTTESLTGQDDYFIRVMMADSAMASFLASYFSLELGWKKVAAVYDVSNRAYSEGLFNLVNDALDKYGIELESAGTFLSNEGYGNIVEKTISLNPDGLLIIGNSFDTANICQSLRQKNKSDIPVAVTEWAFTDELIKHGGTSVEDILVFSPYFNDLDNKELQNFKTLYEERFGVKMSFSSTFGYDAANVLIQSLKKNGNWSSGQLKKNILDIGSFPSIRGKFKIDQYGDAIQNLETLTVRNGEFVKIE